MKTSDGHKYYIKSSKIHGILKEYTGRSINVVFSLLYGTTINLNLVFILIDSIRQHTSSKRALKNKEFVICRSVK